MNKNILVALGVVVILVVGVLGYRFFLPGGNTRETGQSANYVTIEKLGVRFVIDKNAPNIVVTDNSSYGDTVYLSTQDYIDKVGIDDCGKRNLSLFVFNNMNELKQGGNMMLAEQYTDEGLMKELRVRELNDGRVWYFLSQIQAVCYNTDPNLGFKENAKIIPYLERLESTR